MAPFRRRDRDELLEIISCMAAEFQRAAEASKQDAVTQINAVERGPGGSPLIDLDEAIHRAVNAISFFRVAQQLDEIVGIAEGRRNASHWLRRQSSREAT